MYLMYVDESGDIGLSGSPTKFFVLTGIVIHELRWTSILDSLLQFRRYVKQKFGMGMRDEFHASALMNRPGNLARIPKNDRLTILRSYADKLASFPDISIINVVVEKRVKPADYDVFGMAWKALVQRFENTLVHHNFHGPGNPDERGILLPDHTDDKKLTILLRRMRRYNPIPHSIEYGPGWRSRPLTTIIEDPNFRDSSHSHFIQAADLAAYLLYQHLAPNRYMRKKSGNRYFLRLEPVLCKLASKNDPMGIVRM